MAQLIAIGGWTAPGFGRRLPAGDPARRLRRRRRSGHRRTPIPCVIAARTCLFVVHAVEEEAGDQSRKPVTDPGTRRGSPRKTPPHVWHAQVESALRAVPQRRISPARACRSGTSTLSATGLRTCPHGG